MKKRNQKTSLCGANSMIAKLFRFFENRHNLLFLRRFKKIRNSKAIANLRPNGVLLVPRKALILLCLFFSACKLGPDYEAPELDLVDTWASFEPEDSEEPIIVDWWKTLQDPFIDKYIELAKEHNYDLLTAESHIVQARALRQIEASSFYPQIGSDVNATRTYFSKNGPVFAIGPSTGTLPGSVSTSSGLPFSIQTPQTQNLYNFLFDASWELDLFGKTRRKVEAADALIERTIDERNDVLISIIAEIVRNYVELRASQERLKLTQEMVDIWTQKLDILKAQVQAGYRNQIDEESLYAELFKEKAKLYPLESDISKSIYTLSILIGKAPEELDNELRSAVPMPQLQQKLALGLRSDLLRRRPDVRASERRLAEATANIGVAVASFFPTFNLIGDAGVQSLEIKDLFKMSSRTWALGADLQTPIYQGGRLVGNLHVRKAETAAALSSYHQTVLKALEETESSLVRYHKVLKSAQEKIQEVESFEKIHFISLQRYQYGLTNFLDYLQSKLDLNSSKLSYLDIQQKGLMDFITLNKALGGGWEEESF